MKKFWKLLVKYRYIIVILFFGIILIFAALALKAYMYPEDENTNYGTRLDDLTSLSEASKEAVISFLKEDTSITDVNIRVQGKIINLIIKVSTEVKTVDVMKAMVKDSVLKFTEDELKGYDIQVFVTNADANYNLIGYKNKSNEDFSWVNDLIEKETEGEENEEE